MFLIYYNLDLHGPYSEDDKLVGHQLVKCYQDFASFNIAVYDTLTIEKVEPDNVKCLEIFSPTNFSMAVKTDQFGQQQFWDSLMIMDK